MRPERQAGEQLMEILNVDRDHHDAGKRPIGVREAPRQRDQGGAAAQARGVRIADVQTHVGAIALDREVLAIGEIAVARLVACRIEDDVSGRVQHEYRPDPAHISPVSLRVLNCPRALCAGEAFAPRRESHRRCNPFESGPFGRLVRLVKTLMSLPAITSCVLKNYAGESLKNSTTPFVAYKKSEIR